MNQSPESPDRSTPPVCVAVGVIENEQGHILLSQRAADVHQGGLWEFPGGKVDAGETLEQALERELFEELGIRVRCHQPLIRVSHEYRDKAVILDVHRVTGYWGSPAPREGQPLAWVEPEKLRNHRMPAADRPIVTAITLPDTYMITGDDVEAPWAFLDRLDRALVRGERLIQLRAPMLPVTDYRSLAEEALRRCRQFGAKLLLNADPSLVGSVGADGVHLNSRRLMSLNERPLGDALLVAASCHGEEELRQAERLRVDFAVLSPVLPTQSHPGAKTLGWEGFERLVEMAVIPTYPLGGMGRDHILEARKRGGQGIAAIGSLW